MTSFREGDGCIHGLARANLTNLYNVRCLAHSVNQSNIKRVRINSHFALGDDGFLMRVQVFNWVFNGNNVFLRIAVAIINKRRHRGTFTGTSTPHENDQATLFHNHFIQDRR